MTTDQYRGALDAAITEYEALGEQRRALDKRLAEVAQTIGTLSRLLGITPTVPLGLTDGCRLVLRSGVPMTPVDVRDRLATIGMDLSKYSSDLAAIHTVLKRLNEAGEIRLLARGPGKSAYLWNNPPVTVAFGAGVAQYIRESGLLGPGGRPASTRRKPK
jgi:transposase